MIRDNSVDPDVDHARDVGGLVHRPYHHRYSKAVGFGYQRWIYIAEIRRPDRAARRLDRARERAAMVDRIETGGPIRSLVQKHRRARPRLLGEIDRRYRGRQFLDKTQCPPVKGLNHDAVAELLRLQEIKKKP